MLRPPEGTVTGVDALGSETISPNTPTGTATAPTQPRTIDYRLRLKKRQLQKRIYGRTKPGTLLKHHIPVKTDCWDVRQPGFTEQLSQFSTTIHRKKKELKRKNEGLLRRSKVTFLNCVTGTVRTTCAPF